MIPDYEPMSKKFLSLAHHGPMPQAARIASAEGLRSGGQEWWARLREIRAHWHDTGQTDTLYVKE